MSHDLSFKVVVVGDSGVGKTALIQRVMAAAPDAAESGHANRQSEATRDVFAVGAPGHAGVRFAVRTYNKSGKVTRVQYWDAPGADRYAKLTSRYCAGAAGVVVVFDVNSRPSFDHVEHWLSEVERHNRAVARVLIGNKAETSVESRQVSQSQGRALADKLNCKYFETSASTNTRVGDAFASVVGAVLRTLPDPLDPALLLRKSIQIGPRLLASEAYHRSLHASGAGARGRAAAKKAEASNSLAGRKTTTSRADWMGGRGGRVV